MRASKSAVALGFCAHTELTSAARDSKRKWLNCGLVGFLHTRAREAVSLSSTTGTTGKMSPSMTVSRRMMHFITYSFSCPSELSSTLKRPLKSGSRHGVKRPR